MLFLLLSAAVTIASCDSNQTGSKATDSLNKGDTTAKKGEETKPEVDSTKIWKYTTEVDKMTSKKNYYAAIGSTNQLEFAAPYDGGSTAVITVRNQNKSNDVVLTISKGQFVCSTGDGCTIKVRFDSDPAISFQADGPSDGSSDVLFLKPVGKFIKNIKKAKKVIVQAEFYEEGLKEMEFSPDGLKWDY